MGLTPEQIAARKGRITGTRIVKLAKNQRLAVFNEMMDLVPPVETTSRMQAGLRFERPTLEWAAEERGWKGVTYQPGTIICAADPLCASSPDAAVEAPRLVAECKIRGGERAHEYDAEPLADEIVQATWHCGCAGYDAAAIVVLLGGNDLRIFDLKFDRELWEGLREMAHQFHRDHIVTGKPPPFDDAEAADQYLRGKFPRDGGAMLEADASLVDLAHRYRNVRKEREQLEKSEALLAAELKAAIGNASGIVGPDFRVSWKATKPVTRTDWEALCAELNPPTELIVKHSKTTNGSRRFLPTFKGE